MWRGSVDIDVGRRPGRCFERNATCPDYKRSVRVFTHEFQLAASISNVSLRGYIKICRQSGRNRYSACPFSGELIPPRIRAQF